MNEKLKGIVPRIVQSIFDHIDETPEHVEFMVNVSLLEVYMEEVRDLLNPNAKKKVNIRESPSEGIYLENLTEAFVADSLEVETVIASGNNNRKVGRTNMNAVSSRSHMVTMINITQTNTVENNVKRGKLYLVDLAGSERIAKTGATGETLSEGKLINQSLLTLGSVINALTEGNPFIPYRNSKLTRILQESLGGNSRTTLIVTCSPSRYNENETLSTLQFGVRAKLIKNKPIVNEELSREQLVINLDRANKKITHLEKHIEFLEDHIRKELKSEVPVYKDTHKSEKQDVSAVTEAGSKVDPEVVKEFEYKIKGLEGDIEVLKGKEESLNMKLRISRQQNALQEEKISKLISNFKTVEATNSTLSERLMELEAENNQFKKLYEEAITKKPEIVPSNRNLSLYSDGINDTEGFESALKSLSIADKDKNTLLGFWETVKLENESLKEKTSGMKTILDDLITSYNKLVEEDLPQLENQHINAVDNMRKTEQKGNIIFNDKLLNVFNMYIQQNEENERNIEIKDRKIESLQELLSQRQSSADLKIKSLKNKLELLTKAVNICVMKIEEYKTKSFQQQPMKLEINFNEFDEYYSNNFQSIDPISGLQNTLHAGGKVIKLIRGSKLTRKKGRGGISVAQFRNLNCILFSRFISFVSRKQFM